MNRKPGPPRRKAWTGDGQTGGDSLSNDRSISQALKPLQALGRGQQRLVALGKAEPDHAVIGPVLIERRQRDSRDTEFPDQPLRERQSGFVADPAIASQLKIAAAARQELERRRRQRAPQELALGCEERRQRFVSCRLAQELGQRMLDRAVDGEDRELM